jgi:hypothetical protein
MLELLTAQEAADFLRLKDPQVAKRKLREWGVQPYYIGRGRGAGYRYRKDEIIQALEGTRVQLEKKPQRKKRQAKKERTFVDDLADGSMSPGQAAKMLKFGENE